MSTKVSVNTELNKVIVSGEPAKKVLVTQPSGSKIVQIATKGPKGDKGDPGEISGFFLGTFRITGSLEVSGSGITGSLYGTSSYSLTASYVPASAVDGLSLDRIVSGSSSAIISPTDLSINISTKITGSLNVSNSINLIGRMIISGSSTSSEDRPEISIYNNVPGENIASNLYLGVSQGGYVRANSPHEHGEGNAIFAAHPVPRIALYSDSGSYIELYSLKNDGHTMRLYGDNYTSGSEIQDFSPITNNYDAAIILGDYNNWRNGLIRIPRPLDIGKNITDVHQFTGSIVVSGSITSSLYGTASWAENVDYENISNKPALVSGSSQIQLDQISGSTFADKIYTFPNDVVIQGNLTAEQLIISSSVYYVTTSFSSGSTIFGNDLSDTHQFTGSVNITGSLNVFGSTTINNLTGSIFGTASWAQNALTASSVANLNQNLTITGSVILSSSALVELFVLGNQQITGALSVTNGIVAQSITASLFGTASSATNAATASYVPAEAVVGLNLSRISTGSITASVNIGTASFQLNSGSSTFIFVSSSGLVGINTTGSRDVQSSIPSNLKLDINGALKVSGSYIVAQQDKGINLAGAINAEWDNIKSVGSSALQLSPYWGVKILGVYPASSDVVANPLLHVTRSLSNPVSDLIRFEERGIYRFVINNSGSVAINKTSPNSNYILDVSGSVLLSGSLFVSGSSHTISGALNASNITGSLFGTASWARNAVTASYVTGSIFGAGNNVLSSSYSISSSYSLSSSFSQTASFVEFNNVANKPTLFSGSSQVQLNQITGSTFADTLYTFPGDVVVQGNVTAEQLIVSTSVYYVTTSYSSGSTQFGNSSDDRHQFTGSVSITGSLSVQGNTTINNLTGSLFGTASWAQNSATASYVPASAVVGLNLSRISTGSVTASVNIGSTVFTITSASATILSVSSSALTISGSTANRYAQLRDNGLYISRTSDGLLASTITADGSMTYATRNSHIFTLDTVVGMTIFSDSRNVRIGSSTSDLGFKLRVDGSGSFSDGLQVTGSLNAPNITGSLFGTASWALNSLTASYVTGSIFSATNPVLSASYSLTASYALNAGSGVGFPYSGSAQITGSLGVTGSINTTGTFTASLSQGYVWVGGPGNITTLLSTASFGNTGANRKYTQSTPATTWSFNHSLGERYPVIETYDTNGFSIIPGRIETVDDNNLNLYFDDATAGLVVATVGGTATTTIAQTASFVTSSDVWGPFGRNSIVSSSYSLTASYALNAGAGVGFPYTGSAQITGSLGITGSVNSIGGFTGSLLGTASWAQNALTASYVQASAVVGLSLFQIASGSVSASVNINSASFRIVSASNELLFVSNSGQTVVPQLLVSGSGVSRLTVVGSGSSSPIFTVQGSQGELFSVSDSLSGSLFSVNDISGLPVLEAFSDNRVLVGSYQAPVLFTTVKTTTVSGNNTIYTLPTSSYDGAFFEYTIKSGSNSRAGQIMSLWSGSEVNYTEVVTMDFGNTNSVKFLVIVTGSNLALTGSFPTANWTMKTIVRSI